MTIARWFASILLVLGSIPADWARADDPAPPPPSPTLTIRAIHPEREAKALIQLFAGSRASSPAAALSAWKRASTEPKRLGKVGDAIIACLNPAMIREIANLDAAEALFSPVAGSDRWDWRMRFPHDDGTLAALGPTADLSGGGSEPMLGDYRVDRFPGTDLILLARGPAGLFAANSRRGLEVAVASAAKPPPAAPIESGWTVRVDPAARATWTSLGGRRWAEAAQITHCQTINGRFRVAGTMLLGSVIGRFEGDTPVVAPVDPAWLDGIPTRGPLAALGFQVDPRAESWIGLFNLVDRIERLDPARANIAPSRLRLGLAARAFGVRLEADLWPHLIGVSGWVGATAGQLDRGMVAVHLDADLAATSLIGGIKGQRVVDGADEVIEASSVGGRPLRVVRRRNSVFVAWGDRAWTETRVALDQPEQSARSWLAQSRTGALPMRVGAIWLDQLPQVPPGSPLAATLAEAPPLRWAGANEGNRTSDEFWLSDLDGAVRRFLDRLPLDPPPEP